jgi:hypothetical protein
MWKNCPKAWAGSYTGKPGAPSILLETVVDYQIFLACFLWLHWQLGDLNVLNMSPLLERMVDGPFHQLETDAAVVPFKVNEEKITKCFILAERFVEGIKEPITLQEKKHTDWQEACRKDVRVLLEC